MVHHKELEMLAAKEGLCWSPSENFHIVHKPEHYNKYGIQCITAIKASMSYIEFQGYLKGNVEKYVWRFRYKNGLEDLKKAQWYLNKLIEEIENDSTKSTTNK